MSEKHVTEWEEGGGKEGGREGEREGEREGGREKRKEGRSARPLEVVLCFAGVESQGRRRRIEERRCQRELLTGTRSGEPIGHWALEPWQWGWRWGWGWGCCVVGKLLINYLKIFPCCKATTCTYVRTCVYIRTYVRTLLN